MSSKICFNLLLDDICFLCSRSLHKYYFWTRTTNMFISSLPNCKNLIQLWRIRVKHTNRFLYVLQLSIELTLNLFTFNKLTFKYSNFIQMIILLNVSTTCFLNFSFTLLRRLKFLYKTQLSLLHLDLLYHCCHYHVLEHLHDHLTEHLLRHVVEHHHNHSSPWLIDLLEQHGCWHGTPHLCFH